MTEQGRHVGEGATRAPIGLTEAELEAAEVLGALVGTGYGTRSLTEIDWTTEFDHFTEAYAQHAIEIWEDLRGSCPIARSQKFRGMWVPTCHDDVEAIARDTQTFSSRGPIVAEYGSLAELGLEVPPISADPPYHTAFRRALLPFFSPGRVEKHRGAVEAHADALIDAFVDAGACDAALDYARHIPVRVIAEMLGIPPEDEPRFLGWVHHGLETAPVDPNAALEMILDFGAYFVDHVERRRLEPRDDIVSFLVGADLDGRPLDDKEIYGACLLLVIAGIDTTWSAIGATLWHLAQHPSDAQRLREEPELWPTAIEEFLRAFAPVTMAREVVADTVLSGCPMKAGDPLLLPFPSANRDPAAFSDADKVVLDREENRHFAFGVGVHRCLGSNLARMELTVAVQRFVARVPAFRLADPEAVTWSMGQVRGPRSLPLVLG